jgi:hypothetical protein
VDGTGHVADPERVAGERKELVQLVDSLPPLFGEVHVLQGKGDIRGQLVQQGHTFLVEVPGLAGIETDGSDSAAVKYQRKPSR